MSEQTKLAADIEEQARILSETGAANSYLLGRLLDEITRLRAERPGWRELAIERIIQDACELPDRTSPEDQPDMLLITGGELDMLLRRHLGLEDEDLAALHPSVAASGGDVEKNNSSDAAASPIDHNKQECLAMPYHEMSDEQLEAMEIEREAWKLIKAFDDLAEGKDRRIPYAAFIIMMTSFIKTSPSGAQTILDDFNSRVLKGVYAPESVS